MFFHWSLNDSKFPQVSRTLLIIIIIIIADFSHQY